MEAFSDKLSKTFGRPRSMFVPVSMPPAFLKHIKSASRRALGPNIDTQERSGIEFSMRMIGARAAAAASSGDVLEVDDEEDADGEDELEEEEGDARDEVAPIETMTKESMKKPLAVLLSGCWVLCSSTLRRSARRVNSWIQRV